MTSASQNDIECQIRAEITANGYSYNSIATATGLSRVAVRKFVQGGGVRAVTLCKIAEAIGKQIVVVSP